jgi:hypothetical protein
VAQFIGYGEQRRCIACSFHQTQQGEELDPGEWDPAKDPKASELNGCAKCKEPEPASADAAKESSTFAYQVIYKRCHACYLYIWRHSCERSVVATRAVGIAVGPKVEKRGGMKLARHGAANRATFGQTSMEGMKG